MISIGDLTFVGIDPGTTAAVVLLDLDGDLVDYRSEKEFGKDRMIRFIVENGKPLTVATDVNPVPSRVDAVASNMGTALVVPDTDLARGYKDDLTAGFPADAMDAHARDALAAAEYARREYAETVDRARRRAREQDVPEHVDDIIELVVKGGLSVSQALDEVVKAGEDDPAVEETASMERTDWAAVAAKRQDRIDLLESKVANLEEALDRDDEPDRPGIDEDALRARNREINRLRDRVAELEAQVERLTADRDRWQDAFARARDGWEVVPTAAAAGPDADTVVATAGDVPDGVDTVIAAGDLPDRVARTATVVALDDVDAVELDEAYVVDPETVDTGDDAEAFMEWLEDYRSR